MMEYDDRKLLPSTSSNILGIATTKSKILLPQAYLERFRAIRASIVQRNSRIDQSKYQFDYKSVDSKFNSQEEQQKRPTTSVIMRRAGINPVLHINKMKRKFGYRKETNAQLEGDSLQIQGAIKEVTGPLTIRKKELKTKHPSISRLAQKEHFILANRLNGRLALEKQPFVQIKRKHSVKGKLAKLIRQGKVPEEKKSMVDLELIIRRQRVDFAHRNSLYYETIEKKQCERSTEIIEEPTHSANDLSGSKLPKFKIIVRKKRFKANSNVFPINIKSTKILLEDNAQ